MTARLGPSLLVLLLAAPASAQTPQFTPRHLSRFDRDKVASLLRDRLPCLGCHRVDGYGGVIGPDLTGVADRRTSGFIYGMISDPQATLVGSRMPRIPMQPEWVTLVASFLAERKSGNATPGDPAAPADSQPLSAITDGAQLYQRLCAACHGQQGKGDGFNAPNLPVRPTAHADSAYLSTRPDGTLFDGIFSGAYILNKSNLMPAWGQTLSREQIWRLVRYLRTLCRCRGPAWGTEGDGERR